MQLVKLGSRFTSLLNAVLAWSHLGQELRTYMYNRWSWRNSEKSSTLLVSNWGVRHSGHLSVVSCNMLSKTKAHVDSVQVKHHRSCTVPPSTWKTKVPRPVAASLGFEWSGSAAYLGTSPPPVILRWRKKGGAGNPLWKIHLPRSQLIQSLNFVGKTHGLFGLKTMFQNFGQCGQSVSGFSVLAKLQAGLDGKATNRFIIQIHLFRLPILNAIGKRQKKSAFLLESMPDIGGYSDIQYMSQGSSPVDFPNAYILKKWFRMSTINQDRMFFGTATRHSSRIQCCRSHNLR